MRESIKLAERYKTAEKHAETGVNMHKPGINQAQCPYPTCMYPYTALHVPVDRTACTRIRLYSAVPTRCRTCLSLYVHVPAVRTCTFWPQYSGNGCKKGDTAVKGVLRIA